MINLKRIVVLFNFFFVDYCLLEAQNIQSISSTQPVVTIDLKPVCVGSAIDVPFTSTGVYTFNTYTAQLSDSNGVFSSSPTVVGTFLNSDTYDPNLGSMPGSVSGQIPLVSQGCNYYIRVVSSSPFVVGSSWGPFCIGKCDITTNNKTDLNYCITNCSVFPLGLNSLISVDINTFNNTAAYNPGNLFTTQLFSAADFSQIGANGILGSMLSAYDTTLSIHIPCKDSLSFYGIPMGMSYMRVVATNPSVSSDTLGSLIRITIGAANSNAQIISSYDYGASYDFNLPYPWKPVKDTFCAGETAMLLFNPYNNSDMSTYKWISSGINGGSPFVSPSGANSNTLYVNLGGPGILTFKIQETSYGCLGAWSSEDTIVILGAPSVLISGPNPVCLGDTNHYQVPFENNTYYSWASNNGTVLGTSNNEIDIKFNTTLGSHIITIDAVNQCGSSTSSTTVVVNPLPLTPTITAIDTILLSSSTSDNQWYLNGNIILGATSQTYFVTQNGNYTVKVDNSCGSSSFSLEYNFSSMDIDQWNSNRTFLISPNPSNGKFRVELGDLQSASINVFNTMGEIVYQSETLNAEIDFTSKPKGIYFIQVQIGGKLVNKKLIVR